MAYGQVYVDSPQDERFVKYCDSLQAYGDLLKEELRIKLAVSKVTSVEQRLKTNKELGGISEKDDTPEIEQVIERDGEVKKHVHTVSFIENGVKYTDNYYMPEKNDYKPKVKVIVRSPVAAAAKETLINDVKYSKGGLTVVKKIQNARSGAIRTVDSIKVY